MKVAVLTNAFCERDLIRGCVQQFSGLLPHTVLVSKKPWHGSWEPDDTAEVATLLGARVQIGIWQSASEQLNYGLSLYQDYDWILIVDADERYESEEINLLLQDLNDLKKIRFKGSVRTNNWDVYWKTSDYKITPEQTDYPLIAITPDQRFGHIRGHSGYVSWSQAKMHHFSYVRSDNDMLKKIQSFEASVEFDLEAWYRDKWLKWTPDMEDLHPIHPPQFKRAVWDPAPESIKVLL